MYGRAVCAGRCAIGVAWAWRRASSAGRSASGSRSHTWVDPAGRRRTNPNALGLFPTRPARRTQPPAISAENPGRAAGWRQRNQTHRLPLMPRAGVRRDGRLRLRAPATPAAVPARKMGPFGPAGLNDRRRIAGAFARIQARLVGQGLADLSEYRETPRRRAGGRRHLLWIARDLPRARGPGLALWLVCRSRHHREPCADLGGRAAGGSARGHCRPDKPRRGPAKQHAGRDIPDRTGPCPCGPRMPG
jgi:hypothetical protein